MRRIKSTLTDDQDGHGSVETLAEIDVEANEEGIVAAFMFIVDAADDAGLDPMTFQRSLMAAFAELQKGG